jgi:hypothetical protein
MVALMRLDMVNNLGRPYGPHLKAFST